MIENNFNYIHVTQHIKNYNYFNVCRIFKNEIQHPFKFQVTTPAAPNTLEEVFFNLISG